MPIHIEEDASIPPFELARPSAFTDTKHGTKRTRNDEDKIELDTKPIAIRVRQGDSLVHGADC